MSFSIPFEHYEIETQEKIFSIKSAQKSTLIAFLSQETIFIRDSSKFGCPIVSQFTRSEESQHEFGPNYWVQWIDKSIISWGTCSGAAFFSKLDENNQFQEPLVVNLEMAITTTFSAYGYLAICQNNSIVQFISQDGKKISTLNFDKGISRFKSVRFIHPCYFSAVLAGSPVVAFLKKASIEEKTPFLFCFEKETNAIMSAYNPKRSYIAVQMDDHSVDAYVAGVADSQHSLILPKSDYEVVKMEWISNNALFIIYSNGKCMMYDADCGNTYFVDVPQLNGAIDIEFDPFHQQIFYSNMEKTGAVLLTQLSKNIIFTPISVYNILSGQIVASIKTNLPKEIFPIRLATYFQNTYALANTNGFVIVSNGSVFDFVQIQVKNIAVIDGFLFVFHQKDQEVFYVTVYSINDSKEITKFEIQNIPINVSSFDKTIIASSSTKYTIIMIKELLPDDESEIKLNEQYSIKMETFTSTQKLLNVTFAGNDSIVLHNQDGTCVQMPESRLCSRTARNIFSSDFHGICVIHQYSDTILVFRDKYFSFENTALLIDDFNLYYGLKQQALGKISLSSKMYVPYLFTQLSSDTSVYDYFYQFFKNSEKIVPIFTQGLKLSFVSGNLNEVAALYRTMDDSTLASVAINAVKCVKMKDKNVLLLLKEIPWERIIPKLNSKDIAFILMVVDPSKLIEWIKTLGPLPNPDQIIQVLSVYGAFVPSMIVSDLCNVQFIPNFNNPDVQLKNLLRGLKIDKKRWHPDIFNKCLLRILDESKQENNIPILYAALVVSNDPSADEFALQHPELKECLS